MDVALSADRAEVSAGATAKSKGGKSRSGPPCRRRSPRHWRSAAGAMSRAPLPALDRAGATGRPHSADRPCPPVPCRFTVGAGSTKPVRELTRCWLVPPAMPTRWRCAASSVAQNETEQALADARHARRTRARSAPARIALLRRPAGQPSIGTGPRNPEEAVAVQPGHLPARTRLAQILLILGYCGSGVTARAVVNLRRTRASPDDAGLGCSGAPEASRSADHPRARGPTLSCPSVTQLGLGLALIRQGRTRGKREPK